MYTASGDDPTMQSASVCSTQEQLHAEEAGAAQLLSELPDEAAVTLLGRSSPAYIPTPMCGVLEHTLELCRQWAQSTTGADGVPESRPPGALWQAIALLYTSIEGGLRRVFRQANALHHEQVAARTDRLHLTISTLLQATFVHTGDSPTVSNCAAGTKEASVTQSAADLASPGGAAARNVLFDVLGVGAMAALFDEFVWAGLPDSCATPSSRLGDKAPVQDAHPCRNTLVHGALQPGK